LHRAAGKGSKVVWVEADHYFRGADVKKVGEDVIAFLSQSLAGDGTNAPASKNAARKGE
jgi:hypothetical protein